MCILPSNNLAICFVVLNLSNVILIIAVNGAASNTPIKPQIIPQNINDKIIVIGWRPKLSPKTFGSIKLPTIWCTIVGNIIIKITSVGSLYCKKAIGKGRRTAMTDPITGIKFKIKVNVPKINANSNPRNQ